MSLLEEIDSELLGMACSDAGCCIRKPSGMGTNGGCHCLGDRLGDWTPGLRAKIRRVLYLRQHQVRLLTERK